MDIAGSDTQHARMLGSDTKNSTPDPWMDVISQLIKLHDKKKADYAESNNQFSNFEFAALYAGITVNQNFDSIIGTKIARLLNLKKSGKIPNNESIEDTEIDLANYFIIKKAWNLKRTREGTPHSDELRAVVNRLSETGCNDKTGKAIKMTDAEVKEYLRTHLNEEFP